MAKIDNTNSAAQSQCAWIFIFVSVLVVGFLVQLPRQAHEILREPAQIEKDSDIVRSITPSKKSVKKSRRSQFLDSTPITLTEYLVPRDENFVVATYFETSEAPEFSNVATVATLSSTFNSSNFHCNASNAVDSRKDAYWGDCSLVAMTKEESNPSLTVDLTHHAKIWSIEVWAPMRKCDSIRYMGKTCTEMEVSEKTPLVITILYDDEQQGFQELEVARYVFTDKRPVYSWDRIQMEGSSVQVQLRGQFRTLAVTEVFVFSQSSNLSMCSHSCKGECVCARRGEESCAQKVCECGPDTVGDTCSDNMRRSWIHLPQIGMTATKRQFNASLFQELKGLINTNQAVSGTSDVCNVSAKVFVEGGNIGMGGRGAGFASTLHFVSGYLSKAFAVHKPFIFSGRLNYAINKHCDQQDKLGDFECYFQPFSGCAELKDMFYKKWKPPVSRQGNNRCAIGRYCNDLGHFNLAGPPGLMANKGTFWMRAALVEFLMRLNSRTEGLIDLGKIKRDIGFKHPIIGVHVRHGDACHTTERKGRCKGLEGYLPAIKTMSEKYNITRVYLATDDQEVIKESKKYRHLYEFITYSFNRTMMESDKLIERRTDLYVKNSMTAHHLMLSTLIDTLLLRDSDVLVAHLLSNMSRLALELSAAQKLYIPPFISMDGPWCHHWKMCPR